MVPYVGDVIIPEVIVKLLMDKASVDNVQVLATLYTCTGTYTVVLVYFLRVLISIFQAQVLSMYRIREGLLVYTVLYVLEK